MSAGRIELKEVDGFNPIVIGEEMSATDPLNPTKTISVDSHRHRHHSRRPEPRARRDHRARRLATIRPTTNYHNNYQDPEAFLDGGGRRGRQYVPLTDGTYFINRWFANVEMIPKTVVPIGYVGVVVSYYGPMGKDLSGDHFRHGERVARGERGVWEQTARPRQVSVQHLCRQDASSSPRPTSCCTGSPAKPKCIRTTKACKVDRHGDQGRL